MKENTIHTWIKWKRRKICIEIYSHGGNWYNVNALEDIGIAILKRICAALPCFNPVEIWSKMRFSEFNWWTWFWFVFMERIKSLIMKWNHTKLNGQNNKTISLLQQFKQKQIKNHENKHSEWVFFIDIMVCRHNNSIMLSCFYISLDEQLIRSFARQSCSLELSRSQRTEKLRELLFTA